MKKGEEKLWRILQDKLEMLLAGQRLPEDCEWRKPRLNWLGEFPSLAQSYERLGQIHGQRDKDVEAESSLRQTLAIMEKAEPPDQRAIFRPARRLAYHCDVGGRVSGSDRPIPARHPSRNPARQCGPLRSRYDAEQRRAHLSPERALGGGRALLSAGPRPL